MPGVRLRHDELHDCLYLVEIPWRPYKTPFICPTCQTTHHNKTYHLWLDNEGCVIVTETIYQRLTEAGLPNMTMVNVVEKPPRIVLDMGGVQPLSFRVEEKKIDA